MKRRLNILCILIFIAIIGSVANIFYTEWHDFLTGFKEGAKADMENIRVEASKLERSFHFKLHPSEVGAYTDSTYNAKSGEMMPFQYREVLAAQPNSPMSVGSFFLNFALVFIILISAVFQLIVFIRFVRAINKSVVFEWSNVIKLRLMGAAMLVSFVANAIYSYLDYLHTIKHIDIPGYVITPYQLWDFYLLIPGLAILLIAEVFSIGLRLREEQELTI